MKTKEIEMLIKLTKMVSENQKAIIELHKHTKAHQEAIVEIRETCDKVFGLVNDRISEIKCCIKQLQDIEKNRYKIQVN